MSNARLVHVSSDLRDSNIYPYGNAYVLHLTIPLKNIAKVDLVSAHFPNSLYNVSTSSNAISINGNSNIFVHAGRYTQSTLVSALVSQGMNVSYLTNEGHFLISNATSYNFVIKNSQISNIMGFVANQTYTLTLANPSQDPGSTGYYIARSQLLANMTMNDYVFLDVEELRTPHNFSTGPLASNTIVGTNTNTLFAPVMIKNAHLSSVTNFMESKDILLTVYYPEPITSIDRLTIRWRDKYGDIINFQGLNSNSFILRMFVDEDDDRMKALDSLPPPVPFTSIPQHYFIWAFLAIGLVLLLLAKK